MTTSEFSQIILIIDDNPTNLEVLYQALDKTGYKVLLEMDGFQGIETVNNHPPDLILLDVMMPGIDGFETCRQLKSQPNTCDIPIIFMTALTDTNYKVQALASGAVDYITKPFQQEEVLARIGVHLKLRKANLELARQKDILELRVEERTAELSQALNNLKKAHLRLIQHEKMVTLGNLVAGVAHEINNPVGFLVGSVNNIQEYTQDLLAHVRLFQEYHPQLQPIVIEHAKKIELEFLAEDLPKLVDSMNLATERIRDISTSLRTFSRADSSEKTTCNIHEGIESTLLILKYRIKANDKRPAIEVITDYGNLPPVKCFLGQLNQVFMNIIANAIDVLDTSVEEKIFAEVKENSLLINILTEVSSDQGMVSIRIKDNGCGMPESVKARIFDHLFTTKGVGKGTGLGLAIARQIVEETHGGKLTCNSVVGMGTEFVIEIPV
ncbi:MAG: response regulator [Scytonematopsis contorta HA4267-MV1]|jgi:signal transduction histidine kinase|nr:response regulator [Scytonematopsis contorta HA4267-MV1]